MPAWALFPAALALGAWLSPLPRPRWRPVLRLVLAAGVWTASRSLLDALAAEAALALCDSLRNPTFDRLEEIR